MALFKKGKKKETVINKEEEMDLNDEWIQQAPYKRLTNDRESYLELENDYGYMNILSIVGKDIDSMGNGEIQKTLQGFLSWLTQFTQDFTIETTKLPTNVDTQVSDLKRSLQVVRAEMKDERDSRKLEQLQDRERLLINSINNELAVKKQIYNVEFILFIYGETKAKLTEYTRKAKSYGGSNLIIIDINRTTKEQVLDQYNNMNEKF